MSFSIHHNLVVKAEIANVYNAISQSEHLKNWWPLQCSGIAEQGEVYNFNFTDEYDWYAEVLSCKMNHHIHYKITKSDTDWIATSFGFDLKASDNTVAIEFWHINWPACNGEYKQSSYCWAMLLNGLKKYIEKGIIIPFEDRE
jgi:uncharacterized protein YndB with AHSA1/START domain